MNSDALELAPRDASLRTPRVALNGVLLMDKPQGLTSTAALARAKRALHAQKAGHTGTLDPMASGLLPLCFGEATKFAADLLEADKCYEATLQLGITTSTGDAEGEVLETKPVHVDAQMIERQFARFRGVIAQVPPMHSALKRDGKALYEYARAGVTLEREPRSVTIHRLDLLRMDHSDGVTRVSFSVACSKGTYIRTLAEDIGAGLGCGAHLMALRRTRVGTLDLADAVSLQRFEASSAAERLRVLLPLDALIASLPRVDLDPTASARFCQGQRLPLQQQLRFGRVRVYGPGENGESRLLGTGEMQPNSVLAPKRLIS